MSPYLSLNELYAMRSKKKQLRTVCFDRVIELCHRRVRTVASYGGLNTFYEIPGLLVGYPLYNINECMEYMIDHLRRSGLLVQILPPPHVCVIYISWDPQEIKPQRGPQRPAIAAPPGLGLLQLGSGGGGGSGAPNERKAIEMPSRSSRKFF
jgi:hypothetical protein